MLSMIRAVMSSGSRLNVLRSHLCCASTSGEVISRRVSSHADTTVNRTLSVQSTLDILQQMTNASAPKLTEGSLNKVMASYITFADKEKAKFLEVLSRDYQCDPWAVEESITNITQTKSVPTHKQQQKLREVLVAPYEVIFREIGSTKDGVKFLVDLRKDLITATRTCDDAEKLTSLQAMNYSLKQLLGLWFGVGFLVLERITWQSPCDLLEKIADYEAVHPVKNVTDLRTRVGPYRRCFAFLHPSMPREPVVILHVALVGAISSKIQAIVRHPTLSRQSDFDQLTNSALLEEDTTSFDSAIFYSITSTQTGLQGIDLGNYLIKTVVRELQSEFPHLTQFSSLSPIPGFRDWLITEINREVGGTSTVPLLSSLQINHLADVLNCPKDDKYVVLLRLKEKLQDGVWSKDTDLVNGLEVILTNLCARYLYLEKHRNFALNSVANFHLRNGATLWRINYMANTTAKGLMESCGIMVNYRYYLDRTIANSKQYAESYAIDADDQVTRLLD